jgi:hypothetical protein
MARTSRSNRIAPSYERSKLSFPVDARVSLTSVKRIPIIIFSQGRTRTSTVMLKNDW